MFRDVKKMRDARENLPQIGPTIKAFENAKKQLDNLPKEIGYDPIKDLPKEITSDDLK